MATCDNQSCSSVGSRGSYPKSKSNGFFDSFVCGHLAKLSEARHLVKLKMDCQLFVLRFNDIEKISSIYCDYKEENGKSLNRDLKKRKDNFKNTLAQYVTDGSLKKVGSGKDYGKEFLKYEVKKSGLCQLLTSNFSVQKNPCTKHQNFCACHGETSSDTGLGMTQSDDQIHIETHENFRGSRSVLSSEPSSDTGDVSQSDDQFVNETHENFGGSHAVLSRDLSSDAGGSSYADGGFNESMLGGLAGMDLREYLLAEFDESIFDQVNLSTSENETSQRPPPLPTAVDEKNPELTIVPDYCSIEMNLSTSENETSQRPPPLLTAVDEKIPELTIVPDYCSIEGGGSFIVRADQDLQEGIYDVMFIDNYGNNYGTCKASGSGSKYLDGLDKFPAARRRGTHSVTVQVLDVNGKSIGGIPFQYRDNKVNRYRTELVKNSSQSESNLDNEPHQRKKKSSSNSMEYTGSNKKFKSGPVDMPMLMYFCDEMAKGGNEDFFSALINLGIWADVLANRSEYYEDFAVTAREHGHNELAKMIAMSSRELPCDRDMETLTIGKLLDAVQQERSLENSDPVYTSDSDDDSTSCSSGYNGDCDSEDDQFSLNENLKENEDNTDAIFGGCESQNNSDLNDEKMSLNDVIIQEPESPSEGQCCTNGNLKENEDKTDAVLRSCNSHYDGDLNDEENSVNVVLIQEPKPVAIDVEKRAHIFEDEDYEETFFIKRPLNDDHEETVTGVDNTATDSSCFTKIFVSAFTKSDLNDEKESLNDVIIQEPESPSERKKRLAELKKRLEKANENLQRLLEEETRDLLSTFIAYEQVDALLSEIRLLEEETRDLLSTFIAYEQVDALFCVIRLLEEETRDSLSIFIACEQVDALLCEIRLLEEVTRDLLSTFIADEQVDALFSEIRLPEDETRDSLSIFIACEQVDALLSEIRLLEEVTRDSVEWEDIFGISFRSMRNSTLTRAAESGSFQKVKRLIESGANANGKDWLSKISFRASMEIVERLVKQGADVNSKDYINKTAFHYITSGSLEIDKYLVEQGADVNVKENKRTLHYATTKLLLIKSFVDIQNVEDSVPRNDEIIKILELELKKSSKRGQKIQILKAMDNEKLTKVGLPLKYFAPDESLSIRTGSVRRSVCVGVMEDSSEVAVTLRMMLRLESEVAAGSVNHLPEHGARMIKEILTGLEFLHDRGILRRDLKPSIVLVDVVGHMKLADFGMSHVLNEVGVPLKSFGPDESLSIWTGSMGRFVCVGVMEDSSEVVMKVAETFRHLQDHRPRMIKEILNGLERSLQRSLRRDLKPSHVLVDVVGHMGTLVYVCNMEDGSEMAIAAGSIKHLQDHGPRMIEEIITGQTLI